MDNESRVIAEVLEISGSMVKLAVSIRNTLEGEQSVTDLGTCEVGQGQSLALSFREDEAPNLEIE